LQYVGCFHCEGSVAHGPNQKLEDHTLWHLLTQHIPSKTPRVQAVSSIRNLRMRLALVTTGPSISEPQVYKLVHGAAKFIFLVPFKLFMEIL